MDRPCGWHKNDYAIWQCFRRRGHDGPCLTYLEVGPQHVSIQLAPGEYWLIGLMPDRLIDEIKDDIRQLLRS